MPFSSQTPLYFEIIGFSEQERALIASLFKATNILCEWRPHLQRRADCVLLDTDSDEGRQWRLRELALPNSSSIIAVGKEDEKELLVLAQLHRPLRSGQLLRTLNHKVFPLYSQSIGETTGFSPTQLGFTDSMLLAADMVPATPKPFTTKPAVLVINPNPVGWRYITAKLTLSGYQVDLVSTGARAVKLLEGHRYNGVIIEPKLPDMDGFAICKKIKASNDRRNIALILLTASRNPLDRLRGTLAGCDAYLTKPLKQQDLDSVLAQYLPPCVIEAYVD